MTDLISIPVTLDLDALAALVAAKLATPPAVGGQIPANPPPVKGVSPGYVFVDAMLWDGDWDFAAAPNYKDTAPDGSPCMSFTTTGPWGGWLPYRLADLDTSQYTALMFDVWSTVAGQNLQTTFESAGDTADGGSQVYPVGAAGAWVSKNLALSTFKLTNPSILKFSIQDQTGKVGVKTYLRNVRFI